MRRFLVALAILASLATAGCHAARLKPALDTALQWSDGPQMHVGIGEYEFNVPSPIEVGTSDKADPRIPEMAATIEAQRKVFEERAAAVEKRTADQLASIQTRLDNPQLDPATRNELTAAKGSLVSVGRDVETARSTITKLQGEVAALTGQLTTLNANRPKDVDVTLPTSFGLGGIALWLWNLVTSSLSKRKWNVALQALQAKLVAKEEELKKAMDEKIAAFDALPDNVRVLPNGTVSAL